LKDPRDKVSEERPFWSNHHPQGLVPNWSQT
jgi:hypothetical protein